MEGRENLHIILYFFWDIELAVFCESDEFIGGENSNCHLFDLNLVFSLSVDSVRKSRFRYWLLATNGFEE